MIRAQVHMMVAAALCVAAMPLAGCATTAISYPKARTVESAEATPARTAADRLRTGLTVAELVLEVARSAIEPDLDHFRRVAAAIADVAASTGTARVQRADKRPRR